MYPPQEWRTHLRYQKIHLPTIGSLPAGPADIWTIKREHSTECSKPQVNIIQEISKHNKESSDKALEKATYETNPRGILNIKKLEIKEKPEENNDKDESLQNINFFRIRE